MAVFQSTRVLHASRYFARTVRTGQAAVAITRVATLPMTSREKPVRPCVPITITLALRAFAIRTIPSAA